MLIGGRSLCDVGVLETWTYDDRPGESSGVSAVRGNNIMNKLRETNPDFDFNSVHALINDPQLAARDMIQVLEHATLGEPHAGRSEAHGAAAALAAEHRHRGPI
jgi:hypothetical protein